MSTAEFGVLIQQHQSFLKQLAIKLTKHIDDAEDLIQETFYKALKNKERYQPETNMKGWLYTIMKNTFINGYRKNKNNNTFIDETENQFYLNQYAESTRTDDLVDHQFVMNQINSIDRIYLESFMMYFNGYKYEEISEELNLPLGTVKSRIFLARKKMIEKLADYRN